MDSRKVFGMPRFSPMLAEKAEKPFDSESHIFEPKWDGYRCLAYLCKKGTYLDSRNQNALLPTFPQLSVLHNSLLAKEAILDGEIIALKGETPSFSYLREKPALAIFMVFDILWADGEIFCDYPLEERIRALEDVYGFCDLAVRSQSIVGKGISLFDLIKDKGMEGIMAKEIGSPYLSGKRSHHWLKIRNVKQGVFWILGFSPTKGREIGSLVIGGTDRKRPVMGRVSQGLTDDYEKYFKENFQAVKDPPSDLGEWGKANVTWIVPFYGALVDYTEITKKGRLRHPIFRGVKK